MTLNPAKTFGKSLGVAMLATWTDLGATADGVPGGVCPFDLRNYCQDPPPRNN